MDTGVEPDDHASAGAGEGSWDRGAIVPLGYGSIIDLNIVMLST